MSRAEEIKRAAAELFRDKGYHATSLRDIAGRVGIKVPSLYNHVTSKQQLLYEILAGSMEALLGHTRERLDGAAKDPESQLRAFVRALVEIQAGLSLEANVMIEELRALERPFRDRVIAQRDDYQRILEDILRDGRRKKRFDASDVKLTAYAIVGMGKAVADWFRPGGRLSVNAVARTYEDMALKMTGARGSARARARGS